MAEEIKHIEGVFTMQGQVVVLTTDDVGKKYSEVFAAAGINITGYHQPKLMVWYRNSDNKIVGTELDASDTVECPDLVICVIPVPVPVQNILAADLATEAAEKKKPKVKTE